MPKFDRKILPKHPAAPIDPELVINVRDFSRSPGTLRELNLEITPPKIDNGIAITDAAQKAKFTGLLTAVAEGIFVTGSVDVNIKGWCGSCGKELEIPLNADINALYLYPNRRLPEKDDEEIDDEDLYEVYKNEIDLYQAIYDVIGTEIPYKPLCNEDCEFEEQK